MKKILVISFLLLFCLVFESYGEIVQIQIPELIGNSSIPFAHVTSMGTVYFHVSGGTKRFFYYYNGTNLIKLGGSTEEGGYSGASIGCVWDSNACYNACAENFCAYIKSVPAGTGGTYLFDGENEVMIFQRETIIYSVSKNGFVVFGDGPENPLYLYRPDPTVVTVSELKATPSDSQVSLTWKTESEVDNTGFNVWRTEEYQKINTSMIPAKGSPTQSASYEFTDTSVKNKKIYLYKLEDIDLKGTSTMQGPVSAIPRKIY